MLIAGSAREANAEMAVEAFEDIRRDARIVLQDDDKVYWTDDELDLYINEGQFEFAVKTRSLRTQTPITSRENQEVYTIPDEAIEVIRFEDINGRKLEKTSSSALERSQGVNFRTVVGNPSHVYSDLDGENKFRFFPRAKPPIDVAGHVLEPSGFYPIPGFGSGRSLNSLAGRFYFIDTTFFYILDEDFKIIQKIDHTTVPINTVGFTRILPSEPSDFQSAGFGKTYIFADNENKIYEVDKFGVITTLDDSSYNYRWPYHECSTIKQISF